MRLILTVLLVVVAVSLSGCVALGLTAATVGASAFSSGANVAVHAGTEYASGGKVYRTFSLPLADLRVALGDTLARMELPVIRDEADEDARRIEVQARDREIKLRLEPVTRTVTRLRLVVSEGHFSKDRATASEIVAQLERTVEGVDNGSPAAPRATRRAIYGAAPSPAVAWAEF